SIRNSLDVPAPSGEHPSGPIARRPPWASHEVRGRGVQKPLRPSAAPPTNHLAPAVRSIRLRES
ncbi:MAG: hypothetical protein ACYTFX_02905, partial [Planctomycetota bacterium]